MMQYYFLGYMPDEQIRLKCFELAYQTKCIFTVQCISRVLFLRILAALLRIVLPCV